MNYLLDTHTFIWSIYIQKIHSDQQRIRIRKICSTWIKVIAEISFRPKVIR